MRILGLRLTTSITLMLIVGMPLWSQEESTDKLAFWENVEFSGSIDV